MQTIPMPDVRPADPRFSSGPCTKRPGWRLEFLSDAFLGRSHRHALGKARLAEVIERSRTVLGIPADYHVGIVPASDTGAVEIALWSLLGPRGVDVLAWESFGGQWATDVAGQLKLDDLRVIEAAYGKLPDLGDVNFSHDVIFTWNGTTSGVRVPSGDWIADDRSGLTICDATSAAYSQDLAWDKLDVVTWSWQKVLGGEAAHGMLALSPRAIERLENHVPAWPMPKVFRLTKKGKLNADIFAGATINTPSMLAVEDALDGLRWAEEIGGLEELMARTDRNAAALDSWVSSTPWVDYLCQDPGVRSNTSVALVITVPAFRALDDAAQRTTVKRFCALLDDAGAAYDIGAHRDAPPGLRIWCGATVETTNLDALFPWLDWAWNQIAAEIEDA